MCFMAIVRFAEKDEARASEICLASGLQSWCDRPQWFSFWREPSVHYYIPGPDGVCGCSFLKPTTDFSKTTLDLNPAALPRLAGILRVIRQQTSCGFIFEAMWVGDSPTTERNVTIEELVLLIEHNELGTKTRYLVE